MRRDRTIAWGCVAVLAAILGPPSVSFGGERPPAVVAVVPARTGESLVCDVRITGLPGEKAERSLQGGLPSSIDVIAELLDDQDRVVFRRLVALRVVFDLWDEVFRVDDGEGEHRFNTIEEVRTHLSHMKDLPVASIPAIAVEDRYRIRIAVVSHPIAPADKTRIGDWISGEGTEGTARDADEREVSLGIGTVIRYVFGGAAEGRETPVGEGLSGWFRLEDVAHASD